jgi:hypothetical protein
MKRSPFLANFASTLVQIIAISICHFAVSADDDFASGARDNDRGGPR